MPRLYGKISRALYHALLTNSGKSRLMKNDIEFAVNVLMDELVKANIDFELEGSKMINIEVDDTLYEEIKMLSEKLFGTKKCSVSGLLALALILVVMRNGSP